MIDSFHHSGASRQEHGVELDAGGDIAIGCFKALTVLIVDGFNKEKQPSAMLLPTLRLSQEQSVSTL